MTTITPGTPSWVDLASPDLAASKAFYSGLFGWTTMESTEPEAGGYIMFQLDGKNIAGLGPLQNDTQPVVWTTYVSTADADETTALVEKAGGSVLLAPMDVLEFGRMAIYMDPTGAAFAVWQPGTHTGADLFNVPGALTWNELTTREPDVAKRFYSEVFGWTTEDTAMGPVTYTMWKVDDRPVGGMMPMVGDAWPADLPAHWMVYFAVTDTDATAAKAAELGGTVSVAPTDIPAGRFAVLGDPTGAFFSIIKPSPPPPA